MRPTSLTANANSGALWRIAYRRSGNANTYSPFPVAG